MSAVHDGAGDKIYFVYFGWVESSQNNWTIHSGRNLKRTSFGTSAKRTHKDYLVGRGAAAVAKWIRLHLHPAAPGSSPKHTIYAFSVVVKFCAI